MANLWVANLAGANLAKADLRSTNLEGADLHEANLAGATYNGETRFSDGFNPDEAGMKKHTWILRPTAEGPASRCS